MQKSPIPRIPLNTLAVPLGLAGLAEVWSDACAALHFPPAVAQAFWVLAAIAWLWMIAAHTLRGARSATPLSAQLRHPVQGPVAALVPIVGMLLGADLHTYWAVGGSILVLVSMVTAALFAGWIVASWTTGELTPESIHGGYFLPTVAAGFVAAGVASTIGLRALAIGAFAVGAFFWIAMFTVLIARLAFRAQLASALTPTMAIMVAPPAVAGLAWFAISGGAIGTVEYALAGLASMMVVTQLALLPRYRRLPFSIGFWSFTFPSAYIGAYAITWLAALRPAGWQIGAALVLALVTALVLGIAIFSIRLVIAERRISARAAGPAETAVHTASARVQSDVADAASSTVL